MALLFQQPDEVDQKAKEERHTGTVIIVMVLWLLCTGLIHWLGGDSFVSFRGSTAIAIGGAFVGWMLTPYYQEFRIRTKEIDGKVSSLEDSVSASRKEILQVLEKMDAVQHSRDIYELKMELEIIRLQLDELTYRMRLDQKES